MSNEGKPTLVFQGPLLTLSGYGKHALDLFLSLVRQNKYDIKIASTRWGGCPVANLPRKILDEIEPRLIREPLKEQPDVFIQVSIPNEFKPIGKYNIGITAGIETTQCKGEWIEGLNKMDMNIVPSRHARTVFQSTSFMKKDQQTGQEVPLKLEKPIEIVFEGIDTEVYKTTSTISENVKKELDGIPEQFNFLCVGHWMSGNLGEDRKNIGMLVKTFMETFKGKSIKPSLILKTSGATISVIDKYEILQKIKAIKDSIKGADLPNVYVLHGELTDEEMNDLYNHPKVTSFITFTHAEGWGRPLLEFTMSGKPVIATGWSGQLDFLHKDNSVLLPVKLEKITKSASNEWLLEGSQWATVNYSVASKVMEDVFNNYKKYKQIGERARSENKNKFSFEAMDVLFHNVLDRYIPQFAKKVEVILPKFKKKVI